MIEWILDMMSKPRDTKSFPRVNISWVGQDKKEQCNFKKNVHVTSLSPYITLSSKILKSPEFIATATVVLLDKHFAFFKVQVTATLKD